MIQTVTLDEQGHKAREVEINAGEAIQCCRVQDGYETDANQLWFFEPNRDLVDGELVGQLIGPELMDSEPVILRFNSSAAILPIIQDLTIIYGNLVKAGL